MKTYPQYEEPKLMAAEPAVAYQRTTPATYRPGTASRSCKQEEPAKLDDEWLPPLHHGRTSSQDGRGGSRNRSRRGDVLRRG